MMEMVSFQSSKVSLGTSRVNQQTPTHHQRCKYFLQEAWNLNMSFRIFQLLQTQHRFSILTFHKTLLYFIVFFNMALKICF
jgi:hypothetical protein